jgi:hypothetical protein
MYDVLASDTSRWQQVGLLNDLRSVLWIFKVFHNFIINKLFKPLHPLLSGFPNTLLSHLLSARTTPWPNIRLIVLHLRCHHHISLSSWMAWVFHWTPNLRRTTLLWPDRSALFSTRRPSIYTHLQSRKGIHPTWKHLCIWSHLLIHLIISIICKNSEVFELRVKIMCHFCLGRRSRTKGTERNHYANVEHQYHHRMSIYRSILLSELCRPQMCPKSYPNNLI